jgi:hypothetical protein
MNEWMNEWIVEIRNFKNGATIMKLYAAVTNVNTTVVGTQNLNI